MSFAILYSMNINDFEETFVSKDFKVIFFILYADDVFFIVSESAADLQQDVKILLLC